MYIYISVMCTNILQTDLPTYRLTNRPTHIHTYVRRYMHACMHTYIYIYIFNMYVFINICVHVFLFRRIFHHCAMGMCAFVDQLGQRCQTRARPSDRSRPVAERRCALCAQVEVEVMGAACPDAPHDQDSKRRKKSSSIDFEGDKYLVFAASFSNAGRSKASTLAEELGILDLPLFLSFLRYLLGVAESRSGLPEGRLPKDSDSWGLSPLPQFCQKVVDSSDVLHAPARGRAQKMTQLYEEIRAIGNHQEPCPLLISAWLVLVMISVYVGDVSFVRQFIMDDKFFHSSFQSVLREATSGAFEVLGKIIRERLLFWALCRQEMNCFFNCRDGRRTVPRAGGVDETDDEREEEAVEDDQGDPACAGKDLTCHRRAGVPRIAFRSRWVDTLVALVPEWVAAAETAGQQIASLAEIVGSGRGDADAAMEGLRRHFAGVRGLGAPSSVDTARGYRVKFLLSYTLCFLRQGWIQKCMFRLRCLVEIVAVSEWAFLLGRCQCSSLVSRQRVDELARCWTAYGPAPIMLAAKLNGHQRYVEFCTELRQGLVNHFELDLEAYSIQHPRQQRWVDRLQVSFWGSLCLLLTRQHFPKKDGGA